MFWKPNIKKQEYGELDVLKIAFRDREAEKRNKRAIHKMNTTELFGKLSHLKADATLAEILGKLISLREKFKNHLIISGFQKERSDNFPTQIKSDILKLRQLIE